MSSDWKDTPLFRIRAVRDLFYVFGLVSCVYIAWLFRAVTVPCMLSLSVALVLEPVVSFVSERFSIPKLVVVRRAQLTHVSAGQGRPSS